MTRPSRIPALPRPESPFVCGVTMHLYDTFRSFRRRASDSLSSFTLVFLLLALSYTLTACANPCCIQLPTSYLDGTHPSTPSRATIENLAARNARSAQQSLITFSADTVLDPGSPTVYSRLPEYRELTEHQKRLVATLPFPSLTHCATQQSLCWKSFAHAHRPVAAIFYMVTFILERTPAASGSLIERVASIEGVLVGDRVEHEHRGTRCIVDGWRLHLRLRDMTQQDLTHFRRDSYVHPTHSVFGFTGNYRMPRGARPISNLFLTTLTPPRTPIWTRDGRCGITTRRRRRSIAS